MIVGSFKDAVIPNGTALSAEVDLGRVYEVVQLIIPTLTSAQISLQVAEKSGGAFQDFYNLDPASGNQKQVISIAGTGAITWRIGQFGFQFLRVKSSVNQGAARTFRVCGVGT